MNNARRQTHAYDPTPDEIEKACKEILSKDTPKQRRDRYRRSGIPIEQHWLPPTVPITILNRDPPESHE